MNFNQVLIQVIVLRRGEEGEEGGEVEEQQNLSGGVDSEIRNGPGSPKCSEQTAGSRHYSGYTFPRAPHYN